LNWIEIDLLGKSFILKGIVFLSYYQYTPKKWVLQGSNWNESFEDIYQSDNDSRFNVNQPQTIPISINNSKSFTRYRITAQSGQWYNNENYFLVYSIEFFGELLSKS
jgi:hypothetical protein